MTNLSGWKSNGAFFPFFSRGREEGVEVSSDVVTQTTTSESEKRKTLSVSLFFPLSEKNNPEMDKREKAKALDAKAKKKSASSAASKDEKKKDKVKKKSVVVVDRCD